MENVLIAKDLKKTYSNGVEAVQGLDLAIYRGEVFGFLGPNGAGKSTAMDLFTGIIQPSSGEIHIFGQPLSDGDHQSRIGYVPQDAVFYEHLTCFENLELFATLYELQDPKKRIDELMELFELADLKKRRAGEMSGGQKRRLNLAIGLLSNPEILFLDEPSAGMDPQSRNILWQVIDGISSQMTIVLTTHLMEVADRLSDRIAIIDRGKVQVVDTPENLKKVHGNGDNLEITICASCDISLLSSLQAAADARVELDEDKSLVRVSSLNAIALVSDLIDQIRKILGDQCITGISLRENTLENVFIEITGSQLREESS